MTNMKASRKGTRLNEARYFRVPLPHMRKRMTVISVIPRVPDLEPGRFRTIQVAMSPNLGRRNARDCGKSIESKQSSVEIALVTCHGFEKNVDQNKEGRQDICIETEVIEPFSDPPPLTQQEDVPTIIQNDFGKSTEFLQEEDDQCRQTVCEIMRNEKLRGHVEHSCESVDRKQNCGDRFIEIEKEESSRCSSWWKDGGQTILHFFAKILGKHVGMDTKGPADHISPIGKRVKRISRDGKNHNRHRRGIDGGIRLKRVDNGYLAPNYVHRNKRSRQAMTEDKSREEQHHPSILVRQIQRTRDKNLRIVLLERELRIRSSNNKKDKRLQTANSINIRQISSPLC